jgi:hypothetical protein
MGLKSCPFAIYIKFTYFLYLFLSLFLFFSYFILSPNLSKTTTKRRSHFQDGQRKTSNCWSFISIYAQFKSVIRPQFKLILIIHSNGHSKKSSPVKSERNPGRLLKIHFGIKQRKQRNYKFFLWHLAHDKFMILLMIRSRFLHELPSTFFAFLRCVYTVL